MFTKRTLMYNFALLLFVLLTIGCGGGGDSGSDSGSATSNPATDTSTDSPVETDTSEETEVTPDYNEEEYIYPRVEDGIQLTVTDIIVSNLHRGDGKYYMKIQVAVDETDRK